MADPLRLMLAFGLSLAIGGLGHARGSLTRSGWLGAVIVGTASVGLGGWAWGVLVVVFFVTSSVLSHWRRERKASIAADKFDKTERRDLAQTLANGGAIVGLALLHAIDPQPWQWFGAVAALATVNADTWATEIGSLSARPPRLITSGRVVTPGTSGGISGPGTLATVAGALTIGLSAAIMALIGGAGGGLAALLAGLIGGTAGGFADSLIGATIQAQRWCAVCGVETERAVHRCGTPTIQRRGWPWLRNDGVNFVASLVGAAIGAVIGGLLAA